MQLKVNNCGECPFYLIERKDTHEWFNLNISGYYSVGFNGEEHGIKPNPSNDWVNDVNNATQFRDKETAQSLLDKSEFIHNIPSSECEVTEHLYSSPQNLPHNN